MAERLPWIDYLLIDVENEKDSKVQQFYPTIKALVETARSKITPSEETAKCIETLIPCIVNLANEPHRIRKLLEAIVIYTKKI